MFRLMLSFCALACVLSLATVAQAVSLGKIDVASHLGETFYAEVPLTLDEGEEVASVFVELASPSEYQILEVYRDTALNKVRVGIKRDTRGGRVELTSQAPVDSPFFNLVLKVRYGNATHFKKYPIFLDLPRSAKPIAQAAPVPVAQADVPAVVPVENLTPTLPESAEAPVAAKGAAFSAFDGWARTGRYGPMVFGDTLTIVADRLRVDDRYTKQQVMMALFDKNHDKFDRDNVNLIKAGTYLDVPTAAEVEKISPAEALQRLKEHNNQWKKLTKQPHYAAVEDAQRNRYSKHVRVGESASGQAAAPLAAAKEDTAAESVADMPEEKPAPAAAVPAAADSEAQSGAAVASEAQMQLEALQLANARLQAQLAEKEAAIADMQSQQATPDMAAAEGRIKKLEIQLQRMQGELESARQQAVAEASSPMQWMTYALGGLVLLLLGAVGFLLSRGRSHPADLEQAEAAHVDPMDAFEEEIREIDVEEVDDIESVADAEDAFDSIPELTEEDTAEMEAFQSDFEEEPDPNVEYLSEADVYLRYGMEEEAEKQVQMALRLHPDDAEAHAKLVQVRRARGNDEAVEQAVDAAKAVLTGAALATFEQLVFGEAEAAEEISDDLSGMPEMQSAAEEEASVADESAASAEDDFELGDIEWPSDDQGSEADSLDSAADAVAEDAGEEAAAEDGQDIDVASLDDFDFDLSEYEASAADADTDEPVASDAEDAVEAASTESAADIDLSGFDLDGDEDPGKEAETSSDASVDTGELDFDLSDIDLSDEAEDTAVEPEQAEAADDELDFDLSDIDLSDEAEDAAAEPEQPEPEQSEAEAVADDALDLSAFDLGDEAEGAAAEPETETNIADDDVMDLSGFDLDMAEEDEPADAGAAESLTEDATPEASEVAADDWNLDELDLSDEADLEGDEKNLDNTVVLDASESPEVDAFSGLADIDEAEMQQETAPESADEMVGGDLDLGDLDFDLDAMDEATEAEDTDEVEDDFVSTIKTSLDEYISNTNDADSGDNALDLTSTVELDELLKELELDDKPGKGDQ